MPRDRITSNFLAFRRYLVLRIVRYRQTKEEIQRKASGELDVSKYARTGVDLDNPRPKFETMAMMISRTKENGQWRQNERRRMDIS